MRVFLDLGPPCTICWEAGRAGQGGENPRRRPICAVSWTPSSRRAAVQPSWMAGALPQAPSPADGSPDPLTEREPEVLQLLAEGLSNKEIAGKLVVAPSTVKQHLKNIYGKLDVHSRTQAVARGRELELL